MSSSQPAVSIVVPVRNEADNIAPLIEEISAALDGRWAYEIIYVNDGSTDATGERLAAIMRERDNLRQLRHAKSTGQSAAVRSGVRAARGTIVATLDGDGQNNPAVLPDLIAAIEKNQNATGMTLARARSEAIHCTTKRMVKKPCATNPKTTQPSNLMMKTSCR